MPRKEVKRMYYATFQRNGQEHIGIVDTEKGRILNISSAQVRLKAEGKLSGMELPDSLLELVRQGDAAVESSRQLIRQAGRLDDLWFGLDEVQLRAPIPRPAKNIVAVGLNYRAHSREFTGQEELPQFPPVFTKAPTSVIGPDTPIESHSELTPQVDYEAELGIVIGKGGRDIPADQAEEYVFGYTIINDITSRDLQKRTGQWFLGKSLDTFCPMGPYLVHKSAIGWPVELDIASRVNGEVRQSSNTRLLLFDIPYLIEHLSQGLTLEPGDIIATGTPEGVGMGFNPPRFLKTGDVVEVEIEKLGLLKNSVR
jgi:2-keto-4-pentenoate hydratase/2-oxohepta-3-ene-1,7-dioic acid hydratase in catechol pathway